MPNVLPFPMKTAIECTPTSFVYREPTAEETKQIVECLEQIRVHALTLRDQLLSKQAELAATKFDVEHMVCSLGCEQGSSVS